MPTLYESSSSLATWRTCRQKYEFSYIKRLVPTNYSSSIGFGTFVHAWIEYFNKTNSLTGADVFYAPPTANQLREEFKEKHPLSNNQIDFDFDLALEVAQLWRGYWDSFAGDMGNGSFSFIDVEAEWKYDVSFDHSHHHVGKRDGYLLHKGYNKHFLYELKTASDRGSSNYVHRLSLDAQLSSNILALIADQKPVDGVIYDIIWKPILRRKTDRKTMADETMDEFRERIVAEYKANPSQYFERHIVTQLPKHLNEHAEALAQQFKEVEEGVIYRNPTACMNYGSLCAYFELCQDKSNTDLESQFSKKPKKLSELECGV